MIRGSELNDRAIVDLDSAKRTGRIGDLLLDPDQRRVAGLIVSEGGSPFGGSKERIIPASTIESIGHDAVTVSGVAAAAEQAQGDSLPRLSQLTGRKVVTRGGDLIGTVDDVLIAEEDRRIVGYTLAEPRTGGLGSLFGSGNGNQHSYIRAEADIRLGEDLMVVPEDAVVRGSGPSEERRTTPVERPT